MASSFSSILRLELMGAGDQTGLWGDTTNVNLGTLIEQAIAGTAIVDLEFGDVTLSSFNGASDQARCAAVVAVGTPGVPRNIIAPALSKLYVIANNTDVVVTVKTAASTGLSIPVDAVVMALYDTTLADFVLVGQASSSANSAETLVLRDANGDFAANEITASRFFGPVTGDVVGSITGTIASTTTATTQLSSDNSTKVATTAFVKAVVGLLGTLAAQNSNSVAITGGTITGITDITVADGGTGRSTLAANAVLVGNGTSGVNTIAPGAAGNVLTSNGTVWASTPPTSGSIGVDQSWQDVTASRAINSTYNNDTGRPIQVSAIISAGANQLATLSTGGINLSRIQNQFGDRIIVGTLSAIIPDGASYSITSGSATIVSWSELR